MDKPKHEGISRREFLGQSALAGGSVILGSDRLAPYFSSVAPSDRVGVGVVGLGREGMTLLRTLLKTPGVDIAALCDVDELVLRKASSLIAKNGRNRTSLHKDVRRLLEDRSIDAVAIATPNHWHALMGKWSVEAGKDCYIESPSSHSFYEGDQLVHAAQKYKRAVQYGESDQTINFDPVELACLGRIRNVRTVCFVDYSRKRRHSEMNPGPLALFALPDLQTSLNLSGGSLPRRVSVVSAGQNSSITGGPAIALQMEFSNGEDQSCRLDLEVTSLAAVPPRSRPLVQELIRDRDGGLRSVSQITVTGAKGSSSIIQVCRRGLNREILVNNFIAAVKAGTPALLASPIENGQLVAGALHLAHTSLQLQRPLVFDAARQMIDGDKEANMLLKGGHRERG